MSESPASSSELLALWKFIGAACRDTNRAFMACKAEDPRPEQCLKQGEATIACANNVLSTVKSKCGDSFAAYVACLDKKGQSFENCRKTQKAFEECAFAVYPHAKHE